MDFDEYNELVTDIINIGQKSGDLLYTRPSYTCISVSFFPAKNTIINPEPVALVDINFNEFKQSLVILAHKFLLLLIDLQNVYLI
eukprot:UN09518